jgi:hypothetical protein
MRISLLGRFALCASAAIALLEGCGAPQAQIPGPALPQARFIERDAATGSWMLPEASSEDLLYVTNYSYVSVYSYPKGEVVGELKGFFSTVGECVDSRGDVFVTNDKPVTVYEYVHGGTKRIASYPTKKAGAVGCAISPKTGDLAISGGFGSYVEIYKQAKGKPIAILDKDMWYGHFCTYDDSGDLFFLGLRNSKGHPRLSELKSGSSHFIDINADAYMYDEGGIQWDNGYLTAVSLVAKPRTVAIGQFQVMGTKAHEVTVTPLDKPADIVLQYFIDGDTLIVPNLENSGSNVLYYKYPAGGEPTFTLPSYAARGVVVSLATASSVAYFPHRSTQTR